MEDDMSGVTAAEEQYSFMLMHYVEILVENKEIGLKVDEMKQKIMLLKTEQQNMLQRHEKIERTMNLLELVCKAYESANKKMREGLISQVKTEWEALNTSTEKTDDGIMTALIERIKNINLETDGTNEHSQLVSSLSQQGGLSSEEKIVLENELKLALQFTPALSVLEDDLINKNKLLRLERTQLEEKLKRTLAGFARIKLELSRYENECCRLQNVLLKERSAQWMPKKIEIHKILADVRDIEDRTSTMFCQWQGYHNVLCEVLDDVRMFNTQAVKDSDKIWQLCKSCKQLNAERMELLYGVQGKTAQGHK